MITAPAMHAKAGSKVAAVQASSHRKRGKKPKLTDEDVELMKALGRLGISHRTIAQKFDISTSTCTKAIGTGFSLRYRFMKKCGICAEPGEEFRRVYWRFDGQEQQVYESCDACCRAMVSSFNQGNDELINRRHDSGIKLRQLREEGYRLGGRV